MSVNNHSANKRHRPLQVSFSDIIGEVSDNLSRLLSSHFNIEINNKNPDYNIYSVFGNEYLKYKDSVRIFYSAENVRPNFNLCDYSFSFDWLEFGDRHFRCPNFILFDEWNEIVQKKSSCLAQDSLHGKPKFCNFIYSHGRGHPFRDNFFHSLNSVRPVDSLGEHLKNVFEDVGPRYQDHWARQKVKIQSKYKFTIAFENSSSPGYTTEKLVHALAAGTIPIYWGDPLVDRVFNNDRIINLHKMSVEDAIRRIIEIDDNEELFLDVINKPFFIDDQVTVNLTQQALVDKFKTIFVQEKQDAYRRDFYYWGKKCEAERLEEINAVKLFTADLWPSIIPTVVREIEETIPEYKSIILVDNDHLGIGEVMNGRRCIPFVEHEGVYWGVPVDDRAAINEVERQRGNGESYLIFAWPCFWLLNYYTVFYSYLRSNYKCILNNERLIGFDLNSKPVE